MVAADTARPTLSGDPTVGPAAEVLTWAASLAGQLPLSLGVEIGPLADDVVTACFDPSNATGDPALAASRDGLLAFLEAWPDVVDVVLDPSGGATYWDIECTCTPCDGLDAPALGARYEVLWRMLSAEIVARQRIGWWWHNAPDTVGAGSTLPDDAPRSSLDAALDDGVADLQIPQRAGATRGGDSVWGPIDDRLDDGALRQVAGSLDLAVSRHGPTDAVLLDPVDIQDRLRRERARGVLAWFAAVDAPGRRAHGRLEEANAIVAHQIFREFGAESNQVLREWVVERFGLTPETTAADSLADGLAGTGRALDLATHPLGIGVSDLAAGVPASLPLSYGDPSRFDAAWADRVARLAAPDLQTIIDVNQWVREGAIAASEALAAINLAAPDMTASDEQLLRRRIRTLDFAVRGWGLVVLADVTLRALDQGLDEPRLASWLADDLASMATLANDVDAAVATGEIADPFPVSTANLRAIAAQLDAIVGGAVPEARGFPVLFRLTHDFANSRTNFRWGVSPPAIGWVERGSEWPVYDDSSDHGDGPATWWTGWQNGLAADSRVTWRACAEIEETAEVEGVVVCSSDHALWTPP